MNRQYLLGLLDLAMTSLFYCKGNINATAFTSCTSNILNLEANKLKPKLKLP